MFNGIFVIIERVFRIYKIRCKWIPRRIKSILLHTYALFITNIAWVFFRAPNTRDALKFIGTMFGAGLGNKPGFDVLWYANPWIVFIIFVAVIASSSLPGSFKKRIDSRTAEKSCAKVVSVIKYIALLALFYLSVLRVVSGTYNAFIYFQF